ncbi:MAG: type I glyceraldehyde-3-phosphate dehydrogenase [Rickettsiales bacterium]
MSTNIAINGLGRIGRCVLRAFFENSYPDLNLVAINVSTKIEDFINLIKYDSIHGRFASKVEISNGNLVVDGKAIKVFNSKDPKQIPWEKENIDIVLECTGAFKDKRSATQHIKGSVKKVLISAPSPDADATIVFGVNNAALDAKDTVISVGSCTTNALAPLAKIIDEKFGINSGYMTTIHAYTNDQNIVDNRHKDPRRSRAAGLSMIPTSTGAAKAIGLVLPSLKGKLSGSAVRVPTPNVSMVDLVVTTKMNCTKEAVNKAVLDESKNSLKNVLDYADTELVSIDFNHNSHSVIFDPFETSVTNNNLLRVVGWYDNEWGFSCRMLDLATMMNKFL